MSSISDDSPGFCEVWADNFVEEMTKISKLVDKYPYIGMDTEFPGFVIKSLSARKEDQNYHTYMVNVNLLKIIQVGITLANYDGETSTPICTWQFNFKFNSSEDLHTADSMRILNEAHIDFDRIEKEGIDPTDFAALLLASGLVLNENVVWVTFHGGYDFAYLLKMLMGHALPAKESDYMQELVRYFPNFYDLKRMMERFDENCGLADVAKKFRVQRVGIPHQAGSDSYVTIISFFQCILTQYNSNPRSPIVEEYRNKLYGF